METLTALLSGFGVALQPINLLWGFIGVTMGHASDSMTTMGVMLESLN